MRPHSPDPRGSGGRTGCSGGCGGPRAAKSVTKDGTAIAFGIIITFSISVAFGFAPAFGGTVAFRTNNIFSISVAFGFAPAFGGRVAFRTHINITVYRATLRY